MEVRKTGRPRLSLRRSRSRSLKKYRLAFQEVVTREFVIKSRQRSLAVRTPQRATFASHATLTMVKIVESKEEFEALKTGDKPVRLASQILPDGDAFF